MNNKKYIFHVNGCLQETKVTASKPINKNKWKFIATNVIIDWWTLFISIKSFLNQYFFVKLLFSLVSSRLWGSCIKKVLCQKSKIGRNIDSKMFLLIWKWSSDRRMPLLTNQNWVLKPCDKRLAALCQGQGFICSNDMLPLHKAYPYKKI